MDAEALLLRALARADDAVFLVDAGPRDPIFVWVNQGFTALTGHSAAAVTGKPLSAAFFGPHPRLRAALAERQPWKGEIRGTHRSGGTYVSELHLTPVEGTTCFVGIQRDCTDVVRVQEQLAHMAHHDALTGLPNRKLFGDRLDQALKRARRYGEHVGLLFLDLDGFKLINDNLGHSAGDSVLKAVAQRLQVCVRDSDTVARLGGDEFTVVLPALAEPGDASLVAQKVLDAVSAGVMLEMHREVFVTPSIGIAVYPQDGDDTEAIIHRADLAMYRAKQAGKARIVHYRPEMDDDAEEHAAFCRDLRRAVEMRQLQVHWQPILDGRRTIVGAEALLRWHDEVRGNVSPARFIPVLEELGLELEVGRQVIQEAASRAAVWPRHLRLSVNLWPRQVRDPGLLDTVLTAVQVEGISPSRLELDIPETDLMEHTADVRNRIQALRSSGVRIAVDDFGTSHLTLSQLRWCPVDTLKIDRTFVSRVGSSDEVLTRAIVALGHSLGLDVLAEAVETEAQREYLVALGVDRMAGWLFGKAMPASEFRLLV